MEWEKDRKITVEITDIGAEGEGIGKQDGFPFFIKDAVIGDVVEAKIMKSKKNYAYAKLEKVVVPSPFRAQPRCRYHRQCGGCQIQAMDYARQLEFKQRKVRNDLLRIGGFSEEEIDRVMEPIIGMEEPFYYRNKALYPVGKDKEGNPIAGFYAGRTHSIIANTECFLGRKENKEILDIILAYMKEFHVEPYEEKDGSGLVRHILIRNGFASGEIMVCLVLNRKKEKGGNYLPKQEILLRRLATVKNMTSVSVNINTEKTNVILGKEVHTLWGKDTISDSIRVRDMASPDMKFTGEELKFEISPLSFYQVNPAQTEKLYSLALQYAGLTGQETVWDLYCGIGTISLFMAAHARQVYGVEIVPQAIEDAKKNAAQNAISNAEFFVGKAEEILPGFYEGGGNFTDPNGGSGCDMRHPDVILVDPPRKGCDGKCLSTMLQMAPDRIVYVSCDPATLARDLRVLRDGGYELKKARPVDLFGQTVHVETVCQLVLRKPVVHVDIDVDVEELVQDKRGLASYEQIKAYVLEHSGFKVSHLYIAQVKRKCGIIERENYNKPKSEDARQPQCPPEKEAAIRAALEHFGMI